MRALWSATSVVLFLGFLECGGRVYEHWRPTQVVDYGRGFGPDARVFVPSPEKPGSVTLGPGKDVFFRPQMFTARKPDGTSRVVVLGGSSVYLLERQFPAMEEKLRAALAPRYDRVQVLNLGGLSYGSGRLVGVAMEMAQYEPDVLVYYESNNEFTEMEQFHLASLEDASFEHAMSWSAFARILRDAVNERRLATIRAEIAAQAARTGTTPAPNQKGEIDVYDVSPAEAARRMDAFRENVAFIVRFCRSKGVRVVLGSEPSNLVRPFVPEKQRLEYGEVWDLLRRGRFEDADRRGREILSEPFCRHQASDVENGIVRKIAADLDVPLADVEAAVRAAEPHHVPGETLFRDHCHLDERGNEILRDVLADAVVRAVNGPSPPR